MMTAEDEIPEFDVEVVELPELELSTDLVGPRNLKALAERYLILYGEKLEAANRGKPGYAIEELCHLITVWQAVELKEYNWERLTDDERAEVYEAIMDKLWRLKD